MAKGALKNTLNMNYSAENSFIDAYKPDENSLTKTERMDSPVAKKTATKKEKVMMNFLIEVDKKEQLKAYADANHRSISSLFHEMIDDFIKVRIEKS